MKKFAEARVIALWVCVVAAGSWVVGIAGCAAKGGGPKTSAEGAPLKGQSASDLHEPVAKIDDQVITVGEFQQRLNQQSPYIRARYTSNERKKEFLDNMVRFEVLAKEAQTRGYDRDSEVIRTMKQVMIQKLMKEEFENRVKLEDIKDDECMKYYSAHPDEFNKPEEVRVSDLFVKDKKKADDLAHQVAAKAKQGVADAGVFRELVIKNSEDAMTKEQGGDLSYLTENSMQHPKELVKAAFALKDVGNFTATPVKAGEGYHVLLLTGRRKAVTRSFEEVKRQIQNRLYRDKRTQALEDYVGELKKKAHVTVDDNNLSKVMVDTTAPGPAFGGAPMVPGGPAAAGGVPHPMPGVMPVKPVEAPPAAHKATP